MAELVKIVATGIDASWARVLVTDKAGASQAVFKDVRGEVGLMYQGQEADYVENDPTAQMKLEFLQQIVNGNPEYLEALGAPAPVMGPNGQPVGTQGPDPAKFKPRFKELLTKYQANLQQSVKQEQNKQIGRLGMTPGPGSGPE